MSVKKRKLTDYTPDPANANAGTERGQYMLDESVSRVGAGRSLVSTANDQIPAGNKTMQALIDAGITEVIEVETDGTQVVVVKRKDWESLDDPRAREYAYFDNRTSEVGLSWDIDQIVRDLNAGVNLDPMFLPDELDEMLASIGASEADEPDTYTRKIESPHYTPSNTKPVLSDLFDDSKTRELVTEIEASDLPDDEKAFLKVAAQRHTVLNFAKIADYYAHSEQPAQRLMENSALVIIDFERAIELGFVKLTKRLADLVHDEYES